MVRARQRAEDARAPLLESLADTDIFYGRMLTLGPLLAGLVLVPAMVVKGVDYLPLSRILCVPIALGLLL